MEHKIEREWKSIVCPEAKAESVVMCEWDILSEGGHIRKRSLRKIDCHNPKLTQLNGIDCGWKCERAIGREKMTRSGIEWLWVCAIAVAGILWIVFYDLHIRPYLRSYGLFPLFGLPFLIALISYGIWKMTERRHPRIASNVHQGL